MDPEQKKQALEDAVCALKNGVDRMINAAEFIEIAAHYIEQSGNVGLSYALKGHASRVVSAGWMLKSIGNAIGAELLAVTPVAEEFTYQNNNGDEISVTTAIREDGPAALCLLCSHTKSIHLGRGHCRQGLCACDAFRSEHVFRQEGRSSGRCNDVYRERFCRLDAGHEGQHRDAEGCVWPVVATQEGRSLAPFSEQRCPKRASKRNFELQCSRSPNHPGDCEFDTDELQAALALEGRS